MTEESEMHGLALWIKWGGVFAMLEGATLSLSLSPSLPVMMADGTLLPSASPLSASPHGDRCAGA